MGMPTVHIQFSEKAVSAIKRSSKGVVGLILKDDTNTGNLFEYHSFADVEKETWNEENYKLIQNTFTGMPKKVYVLRIGVGDYTAIAEDYKKLLMKRIDYIAYPKASSGEKVGLIGFYLQQPNEAIKLVLADQVADNEKVINVTMGIITEDDIVSKGNMTARIAGVLAGMSQEISSTYYVLPEAIDLIADEIPEDYDAAVDAGKLVFVHDGVKVKVARGVNSLTTTTETKGPSYRKIKLVEAMDMIRRDIKDTFENEYAGKTLNKYINKIQFIGAINIYFKELTKVGILDGSFDNRAEINMEEQLNYIKLNSKLTEDEISNLEEQEIKEWNTGSTVYLTGKIKLCDTMEDLIFPIEL